MCGRMTQTTDPAEIARIFDAESAIEEDADTAAPRYNVAPTQPLTVVLQRAEQGRLVQVMIALVVAAFAATAGTAATPARARAGAAPPAKGAPLHRQPIAIFSLVASACTSTTSRGQASSTRCSTSTPSSSTMPSQR